MIVAGLPGILFKAVVYFWAAGPQLVICLWLAYATCRRRRGRMLDWLIGGFAAALLPVAGVVVMVVLFRRAGRDQTEANDGVTDASGGPAEAGGRPAEDCDVCPPTTGADPQPADPPVAGAGA